jgi:hypothetical protein
MLEKVNKVADYSRWKKGEYRVNAIKTNSLREQEILVLQKTHSEYKRKKIYLLFGSFQ